MSSLGDDYVLEILSWLPAKELYKFKSTAKFFHRIITDLFFYVRQSQHIKADSAILLQGYDSIEMIFLDATSGIPEESLDFLRRRCKRIVASSNGLLIFQNKDCSPRFGDLCAYNPVRRAFQLISPPKGIRLHDEYKIGVCVAFDRESAEYQITCVTPTQTPKEVWALQYDCTRYSSRNMSWEFLGSIDAGSRNIDIENSVMANGSLYWASDTGRYMKDVDPYVLMFDVEKGSSQALALPREAWQLNSDDYDIRVASWDGDDLCLIHYRRSPNKKMLTLWVTEEKAPSQDSWVKVHEVSLESLGIGNRDIHNFSVINSEILVFSVRDELYSYSMVEGRVHRLREHHGQGWYPAIRSYANTLRPCGQSDGFEITT